MGGLSHLFDFNHGSMARKVLTQKRHGAGLEAPRNSLELPVEASQSYSAVGDNTQVEPEVPHSLLVTLMSHFTQWSFQKLQYSYRDEWPVNTYQTEASMKKLINEEISKRTNTRHKAPSVVARLMGMDMLPIDSKPVTQQHEKKNEKQRINFFKHDQSTKVSGDQVHGNSNYFGQREFHSFQLNKDRDTNHQCVGIKVRKPKSREHPQEKELQKFKKEFQEWQAARFRECSNGVEPGRIPSQWLAQETLNREKFALHANSSRTTGSENPFKVNRNEVKSRSQDGGMLKHQGCRKEHFSSEPEEPYFLRSRTLSRDSEQFALMDSGPRLDMFSAPTRIVILRPGPEQISDNEGSWVSSSGIPEERGSIEDFLEEVKERLKYELQGKSKRGTNVRGGGIETPYREKPSEPKQIAQRIAKQVRENVTRDLGINLLRSESTRSSRSEIQHNGPGCPEFINKDTRRVLAERLRNVIKGETDLHVPTAATGGSNSAMLDKMRGRRGKSVSDLKPGGKLNCWDIMEDEPEMQTKSFRHGPDDDVTHHRDLSPRNLSRSLSAPVSGTSFGKLLLEDRHILTGAHIRRKHEAIESVTVDVRKHKKERFNFKEKVSSFKYSFTLRGRLFRRKIQLLEKPHKIESDSKKDITSGLTGVMNFGERHENYTEVPPSPASVGSSVHEELWRAAEHLSSASTSDISPIEDSTVPRVFKEISHNLNELRMQLQELEGDSLKETVIEEQTMEAEMELEDEAEAYIRDLLVVSGLYESSSDKVLSRWDPFAKPISTEIFEEVEESYRKMMKDHEESKGDEGEIKVNRKLLLDLANEALSIILGPPVTMSRFRTKAIGPTPRPPIGRRLLDCVWVIVRAHLYPPTDITCDSLDDMLARDLRSTPWSGLMNEEIDALGKDMESHIIRDLIKEIVKDICQNR